jgi:hypothetical protein
MVNFQNKNRIWINNTLKANAETLDILKLLKDIGIFKEKPKKRKPKSKEEATMEDTGDEFLTPPSGGGGAGGVSPIPPTSQVTQALQALKSGASDTAQQKYLLDRAKEEAQLAIGQLKDARQQDLSQWQQRSGFGLQPSRPTIDWLTEETGGESFFPEKEAVVSEAPQEFTQETGGTNVPEDVMNIDISEKVSPEQGQFEDEEQQTFKATGPPLQKFSFDVDYEQAFPVIAKQYSITRNLSPDFINKRTNKELKEIIIQLANTLGYSKPTYLTGSNNSTLQQRLKKMIIQKYKEDFEELL